MTRLRLRFLGAPDVELDGRSVALTRRKALALLAYLAVSGAPQTRDRLAALLWPDSDQTRGYANLRRALYDLNHALGDGWVVAEGDALALKRGEGLWLDTVELTQAAGQGDASLESLTQATALYRGEFLAGFTLEDSPEFDEWQRHETGRMSGALADVLQRLSAQYEAAGNVDAAIPYAQRWMTHDPLDERAQRTLMRVLALSGQRAKALRQYELLVDLLDRELGVEPEPETKALHEAIGTGQLRPVEGPPAETGPAVPGNQTSAKLGQLPTMLTPFVGREQELATIEQLLNAPETRLLTLLGPGGSGKTRLAIETGTRQLSLDEGRFSDGVVFVNLAPLSTADELPAAISRTFGLAAHGKDADPRQQLLDFLRPLRLLLILDNLEHLLEEATVGLVVEMLEKAGRLTILVTSRERMNLRGEQLYLVPGMRTPQEEEVSAWPQVLEAVVSYSALAMFRQSARRVRPDFELNPATLPAVARICRLTGGMPLAIELAASWVELLTVEEIAAELKDSLDFLESGLRDLPERQRSLRAVFEASWRQLTDDEQVVLQQLAVFRSSFARQAAQTVGGASPRLLLSLVNKSWLQRGGDNRFQMHELLRQYALEGLKADAQRWQAARRRYADHYATLVDELGRGLRSREQKEAAETIFAEWDNIRVAMGWLLEQGELERLAEEVVRHLLYYHIVRGGGDDYYAFLEAARIREPVLDEPDTLLGLKWLAAVYLYEGYSFSHIWDREKLGQVWEQAGKLQMAKQAPEWYAHLAMIYAYNGDAEQGLAALTGALNHAPVDSWVAGYMHVNIGLILHDFNRRVASAEPMSRALAVLRPLGDAHLISTALQHHAIALYHAGELDKADGLLEQARQQAEASGSLWRLIHILDLVARRHVYTGRLQAGWAVLAERRRLHKVRGQKRLLAECVHWDSLYISRFGDLDEALRLRRQAQELARELDDGVRLAWNAFELGELERIRGHIPAAAQAYHEAGRRFQMMDHPLGLAYYQRALGELALAAGDVAVARKHFKQFLDSLDWEMDWNMRYAHLCLARAALAAGDWREVERWLQPLFETALVGEFRELALAGLAVLAAVRQQSGQPEESIELSAFVAAHTYTWQEYRRLARDVQRQASAQLEDATAADAQRRGQAARLEEMIRPFLAEEAYD